MKYIFLLLICFQGVQLYGQGKVEKKIAHIMKVYGVPGVQVAIVKNGHRKTYCVGEQKYGASPKVDSVTLFQAASLSKSVFAYAVMKLYDKGLIDLDTPLEKYMNYDRLSGEPEGKFITARMVLDHTSGLPNWAVSVFSSKWRTSKLRVAFKPGTHFRYSGEGYYFLQKVVEHIMQESLEKIMEEEVFTPLQMNHSSYVLNDSMIADIAVGHDKLIPRRLYEFKYANAAYTLVTTADDYTTFVQKVLIEGEGLKVETHKMMLSAASSGKPVGQDNIAYKYLRCGLGVMLQHNEKGESYYHTGSNPGFRCIYIAYPKTGESVVCFTNSTNGSTAFRKALLPIFLNKQTFWFLVK